MIARNDHYLTERSSSFSVFNGIALSTSVTPVGTSLRGGDWCEVFVVSDDVIALSIGDVCGHGPTRYAAMIAFRAAIADAATRGLDPAQTLAEANRFVCDYDPELHATALLALLDTRREMMTFANAGHPPALMVDPDGGRFLNAALADLPLGIETFLLPTLHEAPLSARTLLVLYTDGITEFDRRPLEGEAQLHASALAAFARATTPAAYPTAREIGDLIFERGTGRDDAAILTAWFPPAARGRSSVKGR